jgi:RND family efflux transporter MFP subunit
MRTKLITLTLIIIVTITTILIVKNPRKQDEHLPNPIVKVLPVKETGQAPLIEISGFARGSNQADISPQASGRILKIFKHEGEFVKQGEVLATLDASQTDAQVSATNSSLDALQKTLHDTEQYYDQLVDEAKSNHSSDEAVKSAKRARDLQIQSVKNQIVSAEGSLAITQAGRKNFTVIAPFAGNIISINKHIGEIASFGNPLISVSANNDFEIETSLSSTDAQKISIGDVASFKLPNTAPISGIVSAVSSGADQQTLKSTVRIHLDNSANILHSGDFLHGEISLAEKTSSILIPTSAVVSRGGDSVIFIIDENNIAKEQPLKLGTVQNGMVEVFTGLSGGQDIVIEGQQYLINGITVEKYATK